MSERQHRRPFHIDTGALVFDVYAVLDIDHQVVQEFDTEAEAEAFVAQANGWDIKTVRLNTAKHGRMLAEYRENLIRHSRQCRKP